MGSIVELEIYFMYNHMAQKVITDKNFGTYVRELYRKVHAWKTILITETICQEKNIDDVDFEGSMEDCIQDLRQRMHHAG